MPHHVHASGFSSLPSEVGPPNIGSSTGAALLKAADRMGLEGDWIKVKCPSWREANKGEMRVAVSDRYSAVAFLETRLFECH